MNSKMQTQVSDVARCKCIENMAVPVYSPIWFVNGVRLECLRYVPHAPNQCRFLKADHKKHVTSAISAVLQMDILQRVSFGTAVVYFLDSAKTFLVALYLLLSFSWCWEALSLTCVDLWENKVLLGKKTCLDVDMAYIMCSVYFDFSFCLQFTGVGKAWRKWTDI